MSGDEMKREGAPTANWSPEQLDIKPSVRKTYKPVFPQYPPIGNSSLSETNVPKNNLGEVHSTSENDGIIITPAPDDDVIFLDDKPKDDVIFLDDRPVWRKLLDKITSIVNTRG